jgi:hypothetical protein
MLMRKVATYAFSRPISSNIVEIELVRLEDLVHSWLCKKGVTVIDGSAMAPDDGSRVEYLEGSIDSTIGNIREYKLTETSDAGLFQTSMIFGSDGNELAVYAELRVGGGLNQLSPVQFDAKCPHVIRTIIDSSDSWCVSETPLTTSFVPFYGDAGAQNFIQILFHPSRNLPVVAISKYEGTALSENIALDIAKDLCRLAIVAALDEEASLFLTNTKGKEWSCFNGAIRLYWPMRENSQNPHSHSLWTRYSLLSGVFDVKDSCYRIRKILRRRVLGASAFSVWEPALFSAIRKASRNEKLEQLTANAKTTEDWREIADSYAKDNDKLQGVVDDLTSELTDLSVQVNNLQLALQWQDSVQDEINSAVDIPPATVADAVEKAREEFTDTLLLGDEVNEGISSLAQNAGPPEKIYQYLKLLSQMASVIKNGSLGTTAIQWLNNRGAICSGESETIKNSKVEKKKRTWKYGGISSVYEMHMKPCDATTPDRCVRIYFDTNAALGKVIIGWVGRHP